MNPDKYNFIDSQKAATAAFSVIDAIQKLPEQEKVLGLASCFLLMCERYNVAPIKMIEHVDRIMKHNSDARYWSCEFTAIKEYLEKEMP